MVNRNKAAERKARAAALKAEQARKEKRRRLLTIVGVVAALVAVVVIAVVIQRQVSKIDESAAAPANATADYGLKIGDDSAEHDVVIYEDFICPACKSFEAASASILATAIDEGRATVEYRPFNFLQQFGDYSQRATNAFGVVLDASGPEVAKEFHDLLYANQPAETGELPDDAWLIDKAVEAGATEADVAPGIEDLAFEGWVDNSEKAATNAGVKGTPTVLVDGEAIEATQLEAALQ